MDVAESFVRRGPRAVGGVGGGGEPALVDSAAMRAERVQVAWIKFQASAGHEEGSRHPARRESHDALARGESFFERGCIRHLLFGRGQVDSFDGQLNRLARKRILLASGTSFYVTRNVDRLRNGLGAGKRFEGEAASLFILFQQAAVESHIKA